MSFSVVTPENRQATVLEVVKTFVNPLLGPFLSELSSFFLHLLVFQRVIKFKTRTNIPKPVIIFKFLPYVIIDN